MSEEPEPMADESAASNPEGPATSSGRRMNNVAVTDALADLARDTDGAMEIPSASELWPVIDLSPEEVVGLARELDRVEAERVTTQRAA